MLTNQRDEYSPEDEVHFPTLTVVPMLEFARHMTEIVMTVFGLRHVRDTLVRDAAIRGVSGGEKKQVLISEALATGSIISSWNK